MSMNPSPSDYRGPALSGYDIDPPVSRIGMISMHTSPLASLGSGQAGGMNLYVRELARHLARKGCKVDVFTRRNNPQTPQLVIDVPGVNVISLDAGPLSEVLKGDLPGLTKAFARNMLAWMRAHERTYDVIHAHYWLSGCVAEQIRDATGVPFVQMFHTTAFHKNAVNDAAFHETDRRERAELRLINSANAVIAANPDERDDLASRRPKDDGMVCSVPLGVDTERFVPGDRHEARRRMGLPQHRTLMLFVGRIDAIKGLDTLLEATRRTGCHTTSTAMLPHLLVVGGDLDEQGEPVGDLARVERQVHELGIAERVTLLGSRSQEELVSLFQAADFVVVPSRYESFGLVAIEAMACGTPVIASRVGGLQWTVRHDVAGLLVPPMNPLALTDAILQLCQHPLHRERLASHARAEASLFSWDRVASAMLGVFRTVTRRSDTPICVA